MNGLRGDHDVVSLCRYHVVCCPKYWSKVLTPPIDERLKVVLVGGTSDVGCTGR